MPIGLFAKIEKRNHENKRRVAKDAEKRGENLFLERSDEPSASLSPRRFSDLATNRIGTEPTTSEDWLNERVGPDASWTAVARRSRDTAFVRRDSLRTDGTFRACESGVALRFPPQSKTIQAGVAHPLKCHQISSAFGIKSHLRRVFPARGAGRA
jgi:hypothetical protein